MSEEFIVWAISGVTFATDAVAALLEEVLPLNRETSDRILMMAN
jgi:hypothetical protein